MLENKILINSIDKIDIINSSELMYITASGKYTIFVSNDNRKITSSQNIGSHAQTLCSQYFVRVHNSYIVNINFIESIHKGENWFIVLKNKTKIPISRRKKDELIEHIKQLCIPKD